MVDKELVLATVSGITEDVQEGMSTRQLNNTG